MINTKKRNIRADEAYAKAIIAWDEGNFAEYDRNKAILEEMVCDHCISREYIRDLEGSVAFIDPSFTDIF